MKTLLLSIAALAVAAAPVFGEDQDEHKQPKTRSQHAPPPAPQRQVNAVPRSYTPRVQPQLNARTQAFQNKPNFNRTYTPRTYTPNLQNRTRTYTPPDQDAAVNPKTRWTNQNWTQNRTRTNPTVVTDPALNTTTQSNTNTTVRNRDWRNRDWQNRTNTNRTWQNNTTTGTFTFDQARRRHHHDWHNRSWWRSRYNRIVLFGGGYYFWDNGYWYPAYGYDPYYSTYAYDEPIYGYNDLAPGQVIANVQSALQEQGYYNDAVDGLLGPRTRAALSDFQRDHGLPITAAIDGPTLQALGLA
jgi:hypothetical protein